MAPRFLVLSLLLTGCADSTVRGPVEVVAYSKQDVGATAAGSLVVFTDVDGSARTTHIDGAGHASGEVEAGGSVWLLEEAPPGSSSGPWITAYTDVQPGDTIQIGPLPYGGHAVRGTMQIVGAPPAGAEDVRFASSCSVGYTEPRRITFDDRCGSTADVLLMGSHVVGGTTGTVLVKYIWLPAQPIVDGGTITSDANAWTSPEPPPTINFLNASGPVTYSVGSSLFTLRAIGFVDDPLRECDPVGRSIVPA